MRHLIKQLNVYFPSGLRMSHFSEDKNGRPPDPTQKTLSDFILAGDASEGKTSDHTPSPSDVCDNMLSVDANCCPSYCTERSRDLLDSSTENQKSDSTYSYHILGNVNEEVNGFLVPKNSRAKVREPTNADHEMKLAKVDSYSGELESSTPNRWNIGVNCADDESDSVSDEHQLFHWVDDYKCSICGIELPTSFIEERQEHSDFHLAERLQVKNQGNQTKREEELSCHQNINSFFRSKYTRKLWVAPFSRLF